MKISNIRKLIKFIDFIRIIRNISFLFFQLILHRLPIYNNMNKIKFYNSNLMLNILEY